MRLGVILTNYNDEKLIGRALKALCSQSYHPDQIVIVDDGSTDASLIRIGPFLKDKRIHVIKHQRNLGLSEAIKSGLKALDTDYVYFASANDYILPGFFEKAMDAVSQHEDLSMIFGRLDQTARGLPFGVQRVSNDYDQSCKFNPKDFFERYFKYFGAFANLSPATIYRKTALIEIGYEELLNEFGFVLDAFVIQLFGALYKSYYLDHAAAKWFHDPESGSSSFFKNTEQQIKYINSVIDFLAKRNLVQRFPPEHLGLFIYSIWRRIIISGYQFDPIEFGLNISEFNSHPIWEKIDSDPEGKNKRNEIESILNRLLKDEIKNENVINSVLIRYNRIIDEINWLDWDLKEKRKYAKYFLYLKIKYNRIQLKILKYLLRKIFWNISK